MKFINKINVSTLVSHMVSLCLSDTPSQKPSEVNAFSHSNILAVWNIQQLITIIKSAGMK